MDELLKQVAGQAPAVFCLIWAIRYMGEKFEGLRSEIAGLREDVRDGRCQAAENER